MFDLQILALQGDLTRVVTLMYGREASQRTYGEIGIPEPASSADPPSRQYGVDRKVYAINVYHAENFAYFLASSAQDGDGSLLDHSCGLRQRSSDPNAHSKVSPRSWRAGKQPGRHIVYPKGTRWRTSS